MQSFKSRALVASTVLILGACSAPKPIAIATEYLDAIQNGDTNTAVEMSCSPGMQQYSPVRTLKTYTLGVENEVVKEGVEVAVVPFTATVGKIGGEDTVSAELWVMTPDDAIAIAQETNRKMAQMGIEPPVINPEDFSKERTCVFMPDLSQ